MGQVVAIKGVVGIRNPLIVECGKDTADTWHFRHDHGRTHSFIYEQWLAEKVAAITADLAYQVTVHPDIQDGRNSGPTRVLYRQINVEGRIGEIRSPCCGQRVSHIHHGFLQEDAPQVISRGHHERIDGKGYPDGLRGDQIPVGARIIKVCDAIDAMLSDRSYRRALTLEQVREQLVIYSGIQFDLEVVKASIAGDVLEAHQAEIFIQKKDAEEKVTISNPRPIQNIPSEARA